MSSSRAIDRPSGLGFAFSAVNCGVGRKIDHQIGSLPRDHGANGCGFGDVARAPVER